jgi:hypothetical protein
MKYSEEIPIRAGIGRVVELFEDVACLSRWQPGLVGIESIKGVVGSEKSKTRFTYVWGKKKLTVTATLLKKKLPEFYVMQYKGKNFLLTVKSRFSEEPETVCWIIDAEYKPAFFMRFFRPFVVSVLRHFTRRFMQNFKGLAEREEHAGISCREMQFKQ